MKPCISDAEKASVWKAYRAGKPTRVPVQLFTNPRVVFDNPEWNSEGYTFAQAAEDPEIHVEMVLRHLLFRHRHLHPYTDDPLELPEVWKVQMWVYNVYEAAILGADVSYLGMQVPDTEPWLSEENKHEVFDIDLSRFMELPFVKDRTAFWHEMEKVCRDKRFEGRGVELLPWADVGTDGPLTVACNLRGTDFLMDLVVDPEYAEKLMTFIIDAALARRRAFCDYWKFKPESCGMADDSCAMISTEMYLKQVAHHHRRFLDDGPDTGSRMIHMCGDATHHFPALKKHLGINGFDTGFPVDHGTLREDLGEDVEILGGPSCPLLMQASPDEVYAESRRILQSGVMRGGRFIFREGNNLPPAAPEANLAAMYQAALDFGRNGAQTFLSV